MICVGFSSICSQIRRAGAELVFKLCGSSGGLFSRSHPQFAAPNPHQKFTRVAHTVPGIYALQASSFLAGGCARVADINSNVGATHGIKAGWRRAAFQALRTTNKNEIGRTLRRIPRIDKGQALVPAKNGKEASHA